ARRAGGSNAALRAKNLVARPDAVAHCLPMDPHPPPAAAASQVTATTATSERPTLQRALGAWDGASLTIGAVIGTGIFLTAGDVARSLPHPLLVLGAWIAGGLLVLAGALSYAELGAMFPRAGGLYHFLREAWG